MSTQTETSAVLAGAAAAPARPAAAAGLSWIDALTLAAIGIVVAVVTLPVLRGFALRENELDALRLLRLLAAHPAPPLAEGAPRTLAELVGHDPALVRAIEDLEALPDGRLRRHGYLFDLSAASPGEPMLRAWPWEHGRTGRGAFVWTPQRGLIGHPNAGGLFEGVESPPDAEDVRAGGWLRMPRAAH